MKHQWICILLGISMIVTMAMPGLIVQGSEREVYDVESESPLPPITEATGEPTAPVIEPALPPTLEPVAPTMEPTSTPVIQTTGSCVLTPPPTMAPGTTLKRKVLVKDTTWTLDQSPYSMSGEIQIRAGVTLTIEPGVVVYGNGNGIRVCGSLKGVGTAEQNIELNDVSICNYGNTAARPVVIQVEFAKINGGSFYTHSMGDGGSYGSLILKNSYLKEITNRIYLDRPQADCQIEKNIFDGTTFSCLADKGRDITIQNNVFYNYRDAAVESTTTDEASQVVVRYNSFLNTDRTALRLGDTTAKMTAAENYFNTVDSFVIQGMIYDKADAVEYDNFISYEPYLQAAHEDTPAAPLSVTPAPVVPSPEPENNQLGGIIYQDKVLTKENSPYYLYQNLQIAPGVTLKVEPGVEIHSTKEADSILNYGILDAAGTAEEMILFDRVFINSKGKTNETPAIVKLDYVKLEDSRTDSSGYGYLNLTNSYLRSNGRKLVSLNYPTEDCRIEKNIIESAGVYSLINNTVTVLIQNNAFYDYKDYAVRNVACYDNAQLIVRYNSFLTTNKTALELNGPNSNMAASENYFNTTEKQVIEAMIYDKNDNLVCEKFIRYEPFLEAPHQDTPAMEVAAVPENPKIQYAENELGGIILEDTVLTRENSPYIMLEPVQVGEDATLTVEPGVVICGEGNSLQIFGKLQAMGTEEENIVFDNTKIECWGKGGENKTEVRLSFTEINGGDLLPPDGRYGALQLTDSYVHDLNGEIYLWYPTDDCNIERNILDGVSISAGIRDGIVVSIQNNVFYNYSDFAVESWNQTNGSQLLVRYNSFLEAGEITLKYPPGYNRTGMTATENYFNTTDSNTVLKMIYDYNKNLSCSGKIEYSPYLLEHHQDTPYNQSRMAKIQGKGVINQQTQYRFIVSSYNIEKTEVQWSVDNNEVASIDENGVLTPKKPGAVTITAQAADRVKQRTVMIWSKCPSLYFDNVTYNSGTGKVTGECHNMLQQDLRVCLVTAAYDADGQVTGIWVEPVQMIVRGGTEWFESSALNAPENGTVKVFAFNTIEGMIPLAFDAQIQVSST